MSTFTDGGPPSVNPGPEGEGADEPAPGGGSAELSGAQGSRAVPHSPTAVPESGEPGSAVGPGRPLGAPPPPLPDSGPLWLAEQMRKRMAANEASGRGRHARGEESAEQFGVDYLLARDGRGAELRGFLGYPDEPDLLDEDETETAWIEQVPPPDAESSGWSGRVGGSCLPDPYSSGGVRTPPEAGGFPPTPPPVPPVPPAGLPPPWYESSADADSERTDVDAFAPIPFPVDDEVDEGVVRPAEPVPPGGPPTISPVVAPGAVRTTPGEEPTAAPASRESEVPARRVRVVLSERKGVARSVRTVVDIQEGTPVGELLSTNLIGSQLAVALRVGAVAAATLGLLPALFAIFPEVGRVIVLGIRLPWLLLGVLVYPFLLGLGWWHTRAAERVEQNFADHVQD